MWISNLKKITGGERMLKNMSYEECLTSFIAPTERDQAIKMAKLNVFKSNEGDLYCHICNEEYSDDHVCHYSKKPHDMSYEQNRLNTFSDWPKEKVQTPEEMAEDGFHYLHRSDAVRCSFCGVTLLNWRVDDIVSVEHEHHNGDTCPFKRGEPTNNKPRQIPFPQYTNLDQRQESFKTEEWEIHGKGNKVEELANAGFFYRGPGDTVQCFTCGNRLNEFTGADDIWFDHAVFFPGCSYLRARKGIDYIRQIHKYKTPMMVA